MIGKQKPSMYPTNKTQKRIKVIAREKVASPSFFHLVWFSD
jgi:hypothetical protein